MQTKIIEGTGIVSLNVEINVRELIKLSDAAKAFDTVEECFKAKKAAEEAWSSIRWDKNVSEEDKQAAREADNNADKRFAKAIEATKSATRIYHGFIEEILKDYQPCNQPTFQPAELEYLL